VVSVADGQAAHKAEGGRPVLTEEALALQKAGKEVKLVVGKNGKLMPAHRMWSDARHANFRRTTAGKRAEKLAGGGKVKKKLGRPPGKKTAATKALIPSKAVVLVKPQPHTIEGELVSKKRGYLKRHEAELAADPEEMTMRATRADALMDEAIMCSQEGDVEGAYLFTKLGKRALRGKRS
jgi:hypothetical protein